MARNIFGGQHFLLATEKSYEDKMDSMKQHESENNHPAVSSLQKILQSRAETIEEKYKVLDARDKLYRILKYKDSSNKGGALSATCSDMCPEKERLMREFQNRGALFEMTNFSRNFNFNHSLAVKEYARSSADQEEPLPHELRPVHVLTMTMSHLLYNVADFCELSDDSLEEWYMFMWDRTRALRKELTQQGVCSRDSVALIEQCARFHIHCAERLIDQDSSIYDDKINTENLTKCLQTLKYMYKDLAKEDLKCNNEPEFVCYSLLLNLNNSSMFTELSDMSQSVMNSNEVKFALDIMTTWETKNYIRFFNLVKKGSYLNCCLLRRYFEEMRLHAVRTMIRSYCTKTYSPKIAISRFIDNLNFEGEDECINFLANCNFNFGEAFGTTVVNFNRLLFRNPEAPLNTGRAYISIEEKKKVPLSMIMVGGPLPPKLFENYVPESSFTENGELKEEALPKSVFKDLVDSAAISSSSTKSGAFNFKTEPKKPKSTSLDIFPKEEETHSFSHLKQKDKSEESFFTNASIFSKKKGDESSANNLFPVFGKTTENIVSNPIFPPNKSEILFGASTNNTPKINQYGNFSSPAVDHFNSNNTSIFGAGNKLLTSHFGSNTIQQKSVEKSIPTFSFTASDKSNLSSFTQPFQFMPKAESQTSELVKKEEDKMEKEMEEKENMRRQKEEEENRKKLQLENEEKERLILKRKKLEEENRKKELERKELEKQELEEKKKREELARLKLEERKRAEEKAKQEQLRQAMAEVKRLEESKKKAELEFRHMVDIKMKSLKKKMVKWKTRVFFDKWRIKTWSQIEQRKMKEYFRESKLKYPPVVTEETLNGNPYGLVIPSKLTFEQFRLWRKDLNKEVVKLKKLFLIGEDLPLLNINAILGKPLEDCARSYGNKMDPFPWKLMVSVPDEVESEEHWKSIETFVEMHFVNTLDWNFGSQRGPLYCQSGSHRSFRFIISIRRLRGCKLYEGSDCNPSAVEGCNVLLFFIPENGNETTKIRLNEILKSKPIFPKIPIIFFILNDKPLEVEKFEKLLDLETLKSYVSEYHFVFVPNGKLLTQFINCLCLSASISAPPPLLRTGYFSEFFTKDWLDFIWRRIDMALSNFKIALKEPKLLIEFYNTCVDELFNIFTNSSYHQQSILSPEFSDLKMKRPVLSVAYKEKVKLLLNRLKLFHWPVETPKTTHQLNYRIHQYCKKVVNNDKFKMKNLKWMLYRTIRRALLWKGLDIFCQEDIQKILINFPWIQVFEEISRVMTHQLCYEIKNQKDIVVLYDYDKIENFSSEYSFISKILKNSKRSSSKINLSSANENVSDEIPCVENDSVVYAYSVALERECNKRKREESADSNHLDATFFSSAEKRMVLEESDDETDLKNSEYLEMQSKFDNLNQRLDELKKKSLENVSLLMDIHKKMQ